MQPIEVQVPIRFSIEDGFMVAIFRNSVTHRETREFVSQEQGEQIARQLSLCLDWMHKHV